MGGLFGGSKSKSYNKAYDQIKGWATPLLDYTGEGASGMSALLGGDPSGFNAFKQGVGYDWELGQGTGDVLAKRAAVGGLDSGASLKRLAEYQTGLNNQFLQPYLGGLESLSGIGLNAANTLTSAGQYSKSKQSGGLGGVLGAGLSGWASGGFKGF